MARSREACFGLANRTHERDLALAAAGCKLNSPASMMEKIAETSDPGSVRSGFLEAFLREMFRAGQRLEQNNHDPLRFPARRGWKGFDPLRGLKEALIRLAAKHHFIYASESELEHSAAQLEKLFRHLADYEKIHGLFADDGSRELLIKLLA